MVAGGGFDVIFARREPGVRPAKIRVFATETVASLQKKIFAATNIPPVQQCLLLWVILVAHWTVLYCNPGLF